MKDSIQARFEGNLLVIDTPDGRKTYDGQFLVAALLVQVARSDGEIQAQESNRMLELIGEHFELRSAESLELLQRAMTEIAENEQLDTLLGSLGQTLTESDRDSIALMMVKVLAADGRADAGEMERLRDAAGIVGIDARTIHAAFDRYALESRGDL